MGLYDKVWVSTVITLKIQSTFDQYQLTQSSFCDYLNLGDEKKRASLHLFYKIYTVTSHTDMEVF